LPKDSEREGALLTLNGISLNRHLDFHTSRGGKRFGWERGIYNWRRQKDQWVRGGEEKGGKRFVENCV